MTRKRRGPDFWKRIAAELAASGEAHGVFAARRGLSVTTLQRWLGRLRREGRAVASRTPSATAARFVEVETSDVDRAPERSPSVEVELPGGVQIRFGAGGDLVAVAEVIALLAARARC
jgi:transposase-like protein